MLAAYDDQVCLFVQKDGGVRRWARIPKTERPGIYCAIWSQGYVHGNALVKAIDSVKAFPIIDEGTETCATSIVTLFEDHGCVVLKLNSDVPEKMHTQFSMSFLDALRECGGRRQQLGPCARLGLMTGGGLPFSKFATDLRNLSAFKSVWQEVLRCEKRFDADMHLLATHEAVLMTRSDLKGYKGLAGHRDNNKVSAKGSPVKEITFLQGQLLLHPPPERFVRCGVLASLVPLSAASYHRQLISLRTRYAQCENGCVARSPLERPRAHAVLGGPHLKLKSAQKYTEAQLEDFVRKNCALHLRRSMSNAPSATEEKAALESFLRDVRGRIGAPISTESALKKAIGSEGVRSGLIRAFAGQLSVSTMWRVSPGGPIQRAQAVYEAAAECFDCGMLAAWVSNVGRKRRAADSAVILPNRERIKKRKVSK